MKVLIEKLLEIEVPKSSSKSDVGQGHRFEDKVQQVLEEEGIEFVKHPNGGQNFPEFLATINGRDLNIECKNSKNGTPMWNSTLPKRGSLYVISSWENGDVGVFMGEHLISDEEKSALEAYHAVLVAQAKAFKESRKYSGYSYGQRGRYDMSSTINPLKMSNRNEIKEDILKQLEDTL